MLEINMEKLNPVDFLPTIEFPRHLLESGGVGVVGRPIFGGRNEIEVTTKLQCALCIGATTQEACAFAGISTDSFYRYCRNNVGFRERVELLQNAPILLARVNIFNAIVGGNEKISMKYLETHAADEFTIHGVIKRKIEARDIRIEYLESLLTENGIEFDYDFGCH